MKINNKQERYNYLKQNIKDIGSYALATYNKQYNDNQYNNQIETITEVVWISKFKKFNNGEDWFLEAPCILYEKYQYDLNDINDLNFVKEQGWMIKNNKIYDIESFQVAPFLPDILEDLILISEDECLEWMLQE